MTKIFACCLIAVVALITGAIPVSAGPYQPYSPKGKFGFKAGMVYSSQFRVDGGREDADVGIDFGILFDIPVHHRGMSGLAVDLHDLHIFAKRKKLLDLSIPLKYRFIFTERKWELRAVAAVGFGYMNVIDKLERTTYLTLKSGVEAVFHSDTRYSLIIDGLIFAAPIGGNAINRVTYGPTLIFRAGIVY